MIALFVTLLLQGGGADVAGLESLSRTERERALADLAQEATSAQVAELLVEAGPRVALGLIGVLAKRHDETAWRALIREASVSDAARGEAAAIALVSLAARSWRLVPRLAGTAGARLDAACERYVVGVLSRLRYLPSLERPSAYRGLLACGPRSARIARTLAVGADNPPRMRAHALTAFRVIVGATAAAPVLIAAIDDADPLVRRTAIQYAPLALASPVILRRFEQDPVPGPTLSGRAAAAIRWLVAQKTPSPLELGTGTRAHLDRTVRDAALANALTAARAWRALGNDRPILQRIQTMARRGKRVPNAARGALLLVDLLPSKDAVSQDVRARLLEFGGPLAAALFAETGAEALASLRSRLAPIGKKQSDEWVRIRLVSRLLRRHDARVSDRVTFLRSIVRSGSTEARRIGLSVLLGLPVENRTTFMGHARRSLSHPVASVRLAAARLFPGDHMARRVLVDAMYDGIMSDSRLRAAFADVWPELELPKGMMSTLEKRRAMARKLSALPALRRD